jgi:hypothetical protein
MKTQETNTVRMGTLPKTEIVATNILEAMATATGKVEGRVQEKDGVIYGVLRIPTEHGVVICTVDQFGDAYRGMVRCWPMVARVREQQDKQRKEQGIKARLAAKLAKAHTKAKATKPAKSKSVKS